MLRRNYRRISRIDRCWVIPIAVAVTDAGAGSVQLYVYDQFSSADAAGNLLTGVTGARAVAAPLAALISTLEPVFAPLWVWLIHAEYPATMTLIGGGVVFAALLAHVVMQLASAHR